MIKAQNSSGTVGIEAELRRREPGAAASWLPNLGGVLREAASEIAAGRDECRLTFKSSRPDLIAAV
jgi:hypothetical protein